MKVRENLNIFKRLQERMMENNQKEKSIAAIDASSNLEKTTENKTSAGKCNSFQSKDICSRVVECAFQMIISLKAIGF